MIPISLCLEMKRYASKEILINYLATLLMELKANYISRYKQMIMIVDNSF